MPTVSKSQWRARLLAARRRRGIDSGAAAQLVRLLAPEVRTVASYWSLADEPDLTLFHDVCTQRGVTLLFPRLLAGSGLELAGGPPRPGLRGTMEPSGPAVPWPTADLVIVPALAVDRRGVRLGRGGGSYDRVLTELAALAPHTPSMAVLADAAEFVDELPCEAHDAKVTGVALPAGIISSLQR